VFAIALIVVLIIYFGLNFYILNHIFAILSAFAPVSVCYALVGIMAFMAILLSVTFLSPSPLLRKLRTIGMIWMGLFIYFLMFFAVVDFINLFITDSNIEFAVSVIGALFAAGLSVYGFIHDEQLAIKKYHVQLSEDPIGLKIALVSDMHIGSVNSEKRIADIVNEINRLDADIVCIAGDIFDGNAKFIQNPDKVSSLLKTIRSKYGVFACLGNHDAGKTCEQMIKILQDADVHLLNEALSVIDNRYVLVGRLDAFPIGGYSDFMFRIPAHDTMQWARKYNLPIIVMDHTPPKKKDMSKIKHYYGNVLLLCGHTHKGQIWPFGFVTKMLFANDYGYLPKEGDRPHIITSCGAGTWGMPMRVGTTREIVRIDVD
jgi:predicted MPP superfamily phosphohydrolase